MLTYYLSGLTLMTGFWYTRREIPLRQCIWYSSLGWGGIVGSYMAMGISRLPANMKPERWELIFYIVSLFLHLLMDTSSYCIAGRGHMSLVVCCVVCAT